MNKIILSMAVLAGCLSLNAPAQAGAAVNGNELLDRCTVNPNGPKGYQMFYCYGYVRAFADAFQVTKALVDDFPVCIPDAVNAAQLADVTVKYLRANPRDRHESVGALVALAFREAYPCKEASR